MIKVGDSIENTVAGVKVTVLKTHLETAGMGFQVEYHFRPQSGQDLPSHYHLWWDEKFEVLSGTCSYSLDGVVKQAKAGDTFTLPAKKAHIHPWNSGSEELHVIQTDTFQFSSNDAVIDTLNTIASQHGLARDGKVGKNGQPNPLQMAVMMEALQKHGGYFEGAPPAVQRFLVAILSTIGKAMGYKASYPEYTND
jgi:quercetin dioxygenase-like cupin family protein